jgi:hypothetical protein
MHKVWLELKVNKRCVAWHSVHNVGLLEQVMQNGVQIIHIFLRVTEVRLGI